MIPDDLPARLDAALADLARSGVCVTYADLAQRLGLDGAGRIGHLTAALEASMDADAQAGRPLRAAFAISRARDGLPARGFFEKAQALGLFDGMPDDLDAARVFHTAQLEAFMRT